MIDPIRYVIGAAIPCLSHLFDYVSPDRNFVYAFVMHITLNGTVTTSKGQLRGVLHDTCTTTAAPLLN